MGALFRGSLGRNRVLWGLYLAESDSKPADSGREPERKAPWRTELGRWIPWMVLKGVYLKSLVNGVGQIQDLSPMFYFKNPATVSEIVQILWSAT